MRVQVDGSPYGGMAYCERFPRDFDPDAADSRQPVFLAQVLQRWGGSGECLCVHVCISACTAGPSICASK